MCYSPGRHPTHDVEPRGAKLPTPHISQLFVRPLWNVPAGQGIQTPSTFARVPIVHGRLQQFLRGSSPTGIDSSETPPSGACPSGHSLVAIHVAQLASQHMASIKEAATIWLSTLTVISAAFAFKVVPSPAHRAWLLHTGFVSRTV
jgi:hypothetical protein